MSYLASVAIAAVAVFVVSSVWYVALGWRPGSASVASTW